MEVTHQITEGILHVLSNINPYVIIYLPHDLTWSILLLKLLFHHIYLILRSRCIDDAIYPQSYSYNNIHVYHYTIPSEDMDMIFNQT